MKTLTLVALIGFSLTAPAVFAQSAGQVKLERQDMQRIVAENADSELSRRQDDILSPVIFSHHELFSRVVKNRPPVGTKFVLNSDFGFAFLGDGYRVPVSFDVTVPKNFGSIPGAARAKCTYSGNATADLTAERIYVSLGHLVCLNKANIVAVNTYAFATVIDADGIYGLKALPVFQVNETVPSGLALSAAPRETKALITDGF